MTSKMIDPEIIAEQTVLVAYSDIEKIAAIDQYYMKLMISLRTSTLLSEMEKSGQRAFLHYHWEEELGPLLTLWSVKLYVPVN